MSLTHYEGNIRIPSSVNGYIVVRIGRQAFLCCRNVTSVTMPNSVTSIGDNAFQYCTGLTTVSFSDSLKYIGSSSFSGCTALTSLEFPNSITQIGSIAFENCKGITSLTIPNSVTNIGYSAFQYCNKLTSITSYITDVFETGSDAFIGCNKATLYVPKGLVDTYQSTPDWSRFTNIEEMITYTPLTIACTDHGKVTINDSIELANDIGEANVYDSKTNTFVFTPNESCHLERVLLDGLDVTRSVNNNQLTTMIRENSKMIVMFSPKGADVNGDGRVDIADVVAIVNLILRQ